MSNQNSLATVIIPTYKRPQLLERAIRSVLNQTCQDFQIHVNDNASGDGTYELVNAMMHEDSRIRYFCHEENIGVVKNCTLALQRVNTPFFSFLCDDDILLPNFLEATLGAFDLYPGAMLSAGVCLIVKDREIKAISPSGSGEGYLTPPDSLLEIAEHNLTWTSALIRTEVVQTIGIFDEEADYAIDVDYLFRIAARHPIVLVRTPSAIYEMCSSSHSAQISNTVDYTHVSAFMKVINNLITDEELSPRVKFEVKKHLEKHLQRIIFLEGTKAINCRNFDYANTMASLLRDQYGDEVRSKIIMARSNTNKYCPPLYEAIKQAYAIASRLKPNSERKDNKTLHSKYKNYIEALN